MNDRIIKEYDASADQIIRILKESFSPQHSIRIVYKDHLLILKKRRSILPQGVFSGRVTDLNGKCVISGHPRPDILQTVICLTLTLIIMLFLLSRINIVFRTGDPSLPLRGIAPVFIFSYLIFVLALVLYILYRRAMMSGMALFEETDRILSRFLSEKKGDFG
jgi:hypothetical protein